MGDRAADRRRRAHHGIRHGLGEGVLMLFGDGRERMADYAHIGHVLILDGQMHIDGVFADRTVLAVNRIGAIGIIAGDRKSTRLNSSHSAKSRMPSSA